MTSLYITVTSREASSDFSLKQTAIFRDELDFVCLSLRNTDMSIRHNKARKQQKKPEIEHSSR